MISVGPRATITAISLALTASGSPSVALDRPGAVETLYDNGYPDAINGYSNATGDVFGVRRTLLDDFAVPFGEIWTLEEFEWNNRHGDLEPLPVGTGLEFALRADVNGSPGDVIGSLSVTSYSEVQTGVRYFSGEENISWVSFDPVALPPGAYWFEATIIAEFNNFWLTSSPVHGSECWVNYEDLGGLQPGSEQFDDAADLPWRMRGMRDIPAAWACCLRNGTCLEVTVDECAAQEGLFLGAGTECDVESCGAPGVCCLPDDTCSQQIEIFCDVDGGSFGGIGVACEGLVCSFCATFAPEALYPAGLPRTAAAGDLDGDLFPDLAVASFDTNEVSILINDGTGGFLPAVQYDAGGTQLGIAIGDVDGDGDRDVVVTLWTLAAIAVLRNAGDGTFGTVETWATGGEPYCVALADLDGDDDLDAVVTNSAEEDFSLLYNDGVGGYAEHVRYEVGLRPQELALGDLDGDEDVDVVVATRDISIYLNQGDGTLVPGAVLEGDLPTGLALGDLDGDTDPDLVAVNSRRFRGTNVAVRFNDGSAGFGPEVTLGAGDRPFGVALVDIDRDRDLDVVTPNFDDDDLSFLFNDGRGALTEQVRLGTAVSPTNVFVADLDFDRGPDVILVHRGLERIGVLLNDCAPCPEDLDGSFAVDCADLLVILGRWGTSGSPADLDGSGVVDFGDIVRVLAGWGPCPLRTGACCLDDGACTPGLTGDECLAIGGDYLGNRSQCAPGGCRGACCFEAGGCEDDASRAECVSLEGVYRGDETTCARTCLGACCFDDGTCTDATDETACVAAGGRYRGDASICVSACIAGACCLEDDTCATVVADACTGLFRGPGTACTACGGACCFEDATCTEGTTEGECAAAGGFHQGPATTCRFTCSAGACCLPTGCVELIEEVCIAAGGQFSGNGIPCPGTCSGALDDCASAVVVPEGFHEFSTVNATTDGPPLTPECDEGGGLAFVADVWYRYEAPCDGTAWFLACESDFDARMAVYEDAGGKDCPGPFVACRDDMCGLLITRPAIIDLPVQAGAIYLIRIGSRDPETVGTGTLEIRGPCP